MSGDDVEAAVDNDIILKALSYGLVSDFWSVATLHRVGVLGAARYVLAATIKRRSQDDTNALLEDLRAFADSTTSLEPTQSELAFVADLELAAQREGLDLDPGETQLAAMVIERSIASLETGDKRAIRALERLLDQEPRLGALAQRVRCLEQIVLRILAEQGAYDRVRQAICDRASVDKALSICFGCSSDREAPEESIMGLNSYIAELQREAPTVLCG